jgi:hypothetical protein
VVAVDNSSKTGTDEVDGATHITGSRAIYRATRRLVIGAVRHRRDRYNGREFRHFDESARDLGDERHEAEEDENHQGANAGGDWSHPTRIFMPTQPPSIPEGQATATVPQIE